MASEDPQGSATIRPRFPGPHRVHGLLHASDHQTVDRPPERSGVRHARQNQDGTHAPGELVHLRERPRLPGDRGRDAERYLDGQPARAEKIMAQDWLRDVKPKYDVIVIGSGLAGLNAGHRMATCGSADPLLVHAYNFVGL